MKLTIITLFLVVCPTSSKFLSRQLDFNLLSVDHVNIATAISVGRTDLLDCFSACQRSTNCSAFFRTTDSQCYLLPFKWQEKTSHGNSSVSVWITKDYSSESFCTAARFPHQRGRSRYVITKSPQTWETNSKYCAALGAKLVQISSTDELKFVSSIIQSSGAHSIHIGLRQKKGAPEPAGGWVWDGSNDPLEKNLQWSDGSPDNAFGTEHFAELVEWKQINDISNDDRRQAVCECFSF